MKINKPITLFLLSVIVLFSSAQQANYWYFGNQAGLNFNTNPPTPLSNGLTGNVDNTSAISDLNGNLLFYTDGVSVRAANGSIMPNGSGLIGHQSAGQCAVIVPMPCAQGKYIIFHVTEYSNPGYLNYSVVDMALNGGSGDVVSGQKNVSLGSGWTEKLCAYYVPSGGFYWLLTHKWNSDEFVAFKIDANSIATTSVSSHIGSTLNCGSYGGVHDAMGQLTISSDGSTIINALTCQDKFEIFKFNLNTGLLSNFISLSGNGGNAWGTAFSPDSKKIYVNALFGQSIWQYDLSNYNQMAIASSQYTVATVGTTGYNFGYMELGPNNKLYITKSNSSFLSTVDNPNVPGSGCNFALAGQSLGTQTSSHGLSRIAYNISGAQNPFFFNVSITQATNCESSSSATIAAINPSLSLTYLWTPGNYTTASVSGLASGIYTVIITGCNGVGVSVPFAISQVSFAPVLSIVASYSTICTGNTVSLTVSGASTYTWSNTSNLASIVVSPTVTSNYTVIGSSEGCSGSSAITINVSECVGIESNFDESNFLVYPNPAQNELFINFTKASNKLIKIQVFNAIGQNVYSVENIESTSNIDITSFSKGIYFVKLSDGPYSKVVKIIKD